MPSNLCEKIAPRDELYAITLAANAALDAYDTGDTKTLEESLQGLHDAVRKLGRARNVQSYESA